MTVGNRMTKNPFTVEKDCCVTEARNIMKEEKIHRLPVIDHKGHLIGIVTEKDILYASPSPASTLDVYEMHSLLSQLTVEKVMTKKVLSVPSETTLEDAARIMADNNIGGLPIVDGKILTGIITESDIFKIFVELFASREKGLRVTALLPQEKGELAGLSRAIFEKGGNIVSFGTVRGDNATNTLAVFKVQDLNEKDLTETIRPFIIEIRDIRKT